MKATISLHIVLYKKRWAFFMAFFFYKTWQIFLGLYQNVLSNLRILLQILALTFVEAF